MDQKPPVRELMDQLHGIIKWQQIGLQLNLTPSSLEKIKKEHTTVDDQLLQMYKLWLETNPQATRRQLIDVLNMSCIGLNTLAAEYTKWITTNITSTTVSGVVTASQRPQGQGASTGASVVAMTTATEDVKWKIEHLSDILKYLRRDCDFGDAQWRELGLKLGILHNALESIEADNHKVSRRMQECLARWLKQGNATKSDLDKAVADIKDDLKRS